MPTAWAMRERSEIFTGCALMLFFAYDSLENQLVRFKFGALACELEGSAKGELPIPASDWMSRRNLYG